MDISYGTLSVITSEANLTEDNVYANYSGRGMYGKQCLGFVLGSESQLLELGAALQACVGTADMKEFLDDVRTDSMGRAMIVYFPSVQVTE